MVEVGEELFRLSSTITSRKSLGEREGGAGVASKGERQINREGEGRVDVGDVD